jgi:hypothetical protein
MYRYMDIFITATPKAKAKTIGGINWGHRTCQVLYPRAGAEGVFLPQVLQNETGRHQDILS